MSRGPEGLFSDAVMKQLKKRGAWAYRNPAGPHGRRGVPDIVGCYNGRFFAWELKAGTKLTVLQARQIVDIVEAGGDGRVLHRVPSADVPALIDALLADLDPDPADLDVLA
jgi:Holliday junction resolvase